MLLNHQFTFITVTLGGLYSPETCVIATDARSTGNVRLCNRRPGSGIGRSPGTACRACGCRARAAGPERRSHPRRDPELSDGRRFHCACSAVESSPEMEPGAPRNTGPLQYCELRL